MTNLVKYAIPMLLGFVGGLASHHFSPSANAQDNDQPDEAEVHELIRTRRLEVVTQEGEPLLTLVARSSRHSKFAEISLGVEDDGIDDDEESFDKVPQSDYGYMLMSYAWSDGTQGPVKTDGTGEREKTIPGASLSAYMFNNEFEAGNEDELSPRVMRRHVMSMGANGVGFNSSVFDIDEAGKLARKSGSWSRGLFLQPNELTMTGDTRQTVYLGQGSVADPVPTLSLGEPVGSRRIRAWVPREGEQLPRIEIRGAGNKLAATLPEESDDEEE